MAAKSCAHQHRADRLVAIWIVGPHFHPLQLRDKGPRGRQGAFQGVRERER
jgi:hypothetical protein